MINPDEEVPVRSFTDYADIKEDTKFSKDEEQESTLRQVFALLQDGMTGLATWDAFSAAHRKDSDLKLKQDIHAHELAYDILAPAYDLVKQALITVDQRFRERNNKQ
jgi:3-phosphoglycerate kinase